MNPEGEKWHSSPHFNEESHPLDCSYSTEPQQAVCGQKADFLVLGKLLCLKLELLFFNFPSN